MDLIEPYYPKGKRGRPPEKLETIQPSSTKNASGERDPEMHQTKKGNQWYFGMKMHAGVDVGIGYIHTITATATNVHNIDQVANLILEDNTVVYGDAGCWKTVLATAKSVSRY